MNQRFIELNLMVNFDDCNFPEKDIL